MDSFKRNDVRIRREIAKYDRHKKDRVRDIQNKISKEIVQKARENKEAIAFEDIRSIYRRGNYQGRSYRDRMNNSWHYGEIKREVEYKVAWVGVPIVHLNRSKTRGTTLDCYICWERLQSGRDRNRQLWCKKCERWYDRDLVAVMNISHD